MFKNHKTFSILLLILASVASPPATAMNYVDYFNQSVLRVEPKEELKISASLGIGSHVNSLIVRDDRNSYSLETTNRNLYLLGIDVNDRTHFLLQVPFKDPAQSRQSRVDSDVRSYSISYNWTPAISSSLSFYKNKGFLLENYNDTHRNYLLPGLSVDQYSGMLYYLSNPKHQSIFIDPIVYKKASDSSSWICILGIDHTDVNNLKDIQILPSSTKSNLNSAQVDSLVGRIAYSKNWFWKNWYTTGAIGGGLHAHSIIAFSESDKISEVHAQINFLISLSAGYIWPTFSTGAFVNQATTQYQFENINLATNFGNMGMFISYQF